MPLNKIVVSLLILFFVTSGEIKSQLFGTKRIGGDYPDYSTIKAAVEALKAEGISSSVVFEINSGTYVVDNLIIESIVGADESSKITFTSFDGHADNVIIKNKPEGQDFLIKLDGCKHLTFNNITFESSEGELSNQIILTGGASYNTFEYCVFKAKEDSDCESGDSIVVIHDEPSEQKQEFNYFQYNEIIGGCIGISLEGQTGELEKGNKITSNE